MVEALSAFNISYDFLLLYIFFLLSASLPVLLNFWSTNPFIIEASKYIYIKKLNVFGDRERDELFI